MPKPSQEAHSFDEFTLDLTRGCLLHRHKPIKLRRKSFEVLKYLVANSCRLISKEELIQAVWVGTAVTDDSLVQCLKDIRHALNDQSQQIIRTVHGRGYIFDSEVRDGATFASDSPRPDGSIRIDDRESSETNASIDTSRSITRLMVMPFRMLRSDPEVEFLSFSVPDAVAGALSVLDSMVVRSPTGAAVYDRELLDLKQIAEETRADAVLTGTILRSGNGIRITCELLEAPSGTVLWWHGPRLTMLDLFELQDTVVRGIVESLSLSLSDREQNRLQRDVPSTSVAYEYYLRANELTRFGLAGFSKLNTARDLYLQCVETDPQYAPAWAHLGRCYRLLGKAMENGRDNLLKSEAAFKRSLELNAELPIAHSQYAFLEAELGRAKDAIARLLNCARSGNVTPDLFVSLVLCCRFCGLLDESVLAHQCARKLDSQVATSVSHTHYQLGDFESALRDVGVGAWALVGMANGTLGRISEALDAFQKVEDSGVPAPMRAFIGAWRSMFEGDRQKSLEAAEQCIEQYLDPEGVFYMALIMARLGESKRSQEVLTECVGRGFFPAGVLKRNPWFASMHSASDFDELCEKASERSEDALAVYRRGGGPELLANLI
jgi:DNA-binding winged helix-turn-helix (wHTH) protein/tetratricopeptide (TPR) repeat protein